MTCSEPQTRRHPWWREGEVIALVALVAAAYFARIDALTIRGEESRWATVAREMMRTGDYVVPRQFGEPFLSRPPLHNWLIAAAAAARGRLDAVAVRLPTATALLLATILIYAYGRTFLGRLGAFAAAAGFATMGEVLQLGRIAESDTVFTFLLSAAVLLWHWGYSRGWPSVLTWCLGYGFAALAALTKGPQAPVYFAGTVGLYLVWRRDWRRLFGVGHFVGLAAFAAIVLAWQIPFTRECGWEATRQIWGSDSAARFENLRVGQVALHLVTYPLEVVGCTAPWSLLLSAFLSRRLRRSLGSARPHAVFLAIYFALGVLPCWASPGGMTRYAYPLYPTVALLAGLVVERVVRGELSPRLRRAWGVGWTGCATAVAATVVGVVAVSVARVPAFAGPWVQPPALLAAFAVGSAVAASAVWLGRRWYDRRRLRLAVGGLAGFMALAYAVVVVNALCARSADAASAVARVRARVPAGATMVGIDGTHHLFAYYYGAPIEARPSRRIVFGDNADVTYFCYEALRDERKPLPFAWEEIAVVPVDRNRQPSPVNVVVVGRRVAGR